MPGAHERERKSLACRGRAERNAWLVERLQTLEPEEIKLLMEAMPVLEKLAPSVPD